MLTKGITMLSFISRTIGGLTRDLEEAITSTANYIIDEVASVPSNLMEGYDKGLISGTDSEPTEADAVTPAPKNHVPFGTRV